MRTNKRVTNKRNKITSYILNSFENESVSKKKHLLVEILNLSKMSFGLVIVVVKNSRIETVKSLTSYCVLSKIASTKVLSVYAIKVDKIAFSKLIDFAIHNEERTEIFLDDSVDYDDYIHKICNNNNIRVGFEVVINDNNNTFINIKQDIHDYNEIDNKLKNLLMVS